MHRNVKSMLCKLVLLVIFLGGEGASSFVGTRFVVMIGKPTSHLICLAAAHLAGDL
jgi:hypothetical protein